MLRLFPFTGESHLLAGRLARGVYYNMGGVDRSLPREIFPFIPDVATSCQNQQLPTKDLHETWIRFKNKIKQCPNHGLPDDVLLQTFNRSLDAVNKSAANNVAKGSLMENSFEVASGLLDKLARLIKLGIQGSRK